MATRKPVGKQMAVEEILANWATLNEYLKDCPESDAKALLDAETKGRCRQQYVLRIHGRFNRARAARERAEIFGKLSAAG